MSLPADYHMHTRLCRHAVGDPIDLAAQAVCLGLAEIGFSEHNPMPRDDWDDWHMLQADLDTYVENVQKARQAYPNLVIKLALEMDFIPGQEDWARQLIGRHKWDYIIGAVHYVSDSWDLDNPKRISEWKRREPFEVWTAYFERLAMAAESGLFDIIAHADLCKKFCFYPKEDCTPLFGKFIEAARKAGMAMELNTAGLRKDCKEIYPSRQIVQMAREAGLPITFGSDAHAPGEVGMNFSDAIALACGAGYTQWCRFTARARESVKL
jgi:histidinol-phosphatase (PHP family)